jgi:hypothetical protein
MFPEDAMDAATLVEVADAAAMDAKRQHRAETESRAA